MKPVPLSLTDNQLAVVLVGARSVPACRALMGGRPASDTAVAAAVERPQFRFGL
jgi:hypothetical protein